MAQILVVNENNCWYQGIAALENFYEIELEQKIQKHADDAFNGYYTIKGKYTFSNRAKETSDGDLLLISKDFTKWFILEVELIAKSLSHTKKQLRVFSAPIFDIDDLVEYCVRQRAELGNSRENLKELFSTPPEVLVVFDTYHKKKLTQLQKDFKSIKICVFEVYKTNTHDFETYRISGDYPYIISGYSYLKPSSGFETYSIERYDLMNGVPRGDIDVLYKMAKFKAKLLESKGVLFLQIPRNPFTAGKQLTLSRTHDSKFIIDPIN
jgi:hypothetical protein